MDVLAELLGQARNIGELREQIRQILARTAHSSRLPPILLLGETGTGKGLVAHVIHRAGPRATGPFVDVNCAAIPDTLLEAELFGFERGAFTDARQPKAGLFQSAHGGTIFLDEIALLPEPLQAKLLQVIEDRSVRRLGSTRSEPVDVSIIAATNDDLLAATQARRFREDLYHRLAVLTLRLPPLRERRDDIPLLAEHFLGHACRDYGLPPKVLTPAAGAALCAYPWPGNVRELANVMERVALLVETSHIGPAMLDLPAEAAPQVPGSAAAPSGSSLDARVEAWERDELRSALDETRWNVARAAVRLGISRGTIRYRIGKYSLEPPTTRGRRRGASGMSAPQPSPPPAPAPPAVTHWERRLVALLQVTVRPLAVEEASLAELGRDLDVVVQKVESFAGRIEEAGPSRILAAFGLDPVEDAPRRAALAGIAIQKAMERVRQAEPHRAAITVAIHAEECSVGEVSGRVLIDAEAKRRMAMVLEQVGARAEPDTIFVSPAARWLLGPRFDVDEPDEGDGGASRGLRLRGYSQHRFGLHPAPFVGRDPELRVLQTLWQQALQQRGQAVAVVGEPGIGKSRLLFEFRRALGDGPLTYLEGRGESYGGGIPYWPVIELLKGYFHIDERDDPLAAGEKVKAQLLALDPALESDLPAFLALLDAPGADPLWQALDPPQRRQRTLDALTRLVVRLSQAQPVLLAIEDLHWIDAETEAFLDRVISRLPAARLLVLVTYRPEYQHHWGSTTSYTQLHLDPLQTASAEALAGSLVGHDIALQPLKRLLTERTEGNPFFLEESVRALVETGDLAGERGAYRLTRPVEQLTIPATVQAILAARIDRLAPEAKRLLQAAAVIGKDVALPLLLAIADAPEPEVRAELTRLQAAEFLSETRLFPDLEYTFKHALTHEVAYGGLLHDQQRALHARITEAIERLAPERVAEQVERLAYHALRGELWEKAVAYLRQAGLRAMARAAFSEAIAHLDQALGALHHLPESRETTELTIDTHIDLRYALQPLGDVARAGEHLHEAEVLARTLGDQHRLGRIATFMVIQYLITGDYDDAVRFGQEALSIARTLGDRAIEVVATSFLGQTYAVRGEFSAAATFLERNVALEGDLRYERFGTPIIQSARSGANLADVLSQLGRFDEAIRHAEAAVQIAGDHPFTLFQGLFDLGLAHLRRGDLPHATRVFERGLDLCRTWQFVLGMSLVASLLGASYALAGRADEALPLVASAAEEFRRRQVHHWPALILQCAGMASLSAGQIDEAASYAREALALSRRLGARGSEAHALCLAGDVASTVSAEDASGYYRESLALADELGMRPLAAHCYLGLGKLYRRTGKREQAQEHLATATMMYRGMDMRFWLKQAEAEMGGLA